MKKFLAIAFLFLASCSDSEHPTEVLVKDAQMCPAKDIVNGVEFICPNGTFTVYDGANGTNGTNGNTCRIEFTVEGSFYVCDGQQPIPIPTQGSSDPQTPTTVVTGPQGETGATGATGPQGEPGKDGKDGTSASCSFREDASHCIWLWCTGFTKEVKIRGPL